MIIHTLHRPWSNLLIQGQKKKSIGIIVSSLLGSRGPEGHFLAATLPHGLLRWQLLRTMDSEPRSGPATPGSLPAFIWQGSGF